MCTCAVAISAATNDDAVWLNTFMFLFSQFFLELNYYSQHIHTSSSSSYPALTQQLEALRKIDPEFAELEGTAFDSVIAGFTSLTTDMLSMVTTHIITTLQTTLKPYQANK